MTPKPLTASTPASTAAAASPSPRASASRASGIVKSTAPTAMVRPAPIRRPTGPAARAPATPPRAPTPRARPIVPADSPSVRLAKTRTTALTMKVKKLTQVTQRRAGAR